jgi:putative FmdB family regulatory protein
MPLYEYRCKDCGEEFEKQLRFAESGQLPACPRCSSASTQKKLSRVTLLAPLDASAGGSSAGGNCGPGETFT